MDYGSFAIGPILAAGVAFMLVGSMWYGPLFGKTWMALSGYTMEKVAATPKNVMTRMYVGSLLAALGAAYVLSLIIEATLMTTVSGGITLGIMTAIGFSCTAFASNYLFNQKPLRLFVIDCGYQIVCLAIAGAILGGWR
jgi:hypothetical protein